MKPETKNLPQTLALSVTDASGVGEARRVAAATAIRLGFDETGIGNLSIVITEAARNLIHHGGGGEVLLSTLCEDSPQRVGIEVLALDRGAGMANVGQCLRDGYSTRGTAGTGLGAIARLSHGFDIHSRPGLGAAVLARLWRGPAERQPPPRLEVRGVSVPKPGQTACGDGWAAKQRGGAASILVADGLGHGPDAARASAEAVRIFLELDLPPDALLTRAHQALRRTRGAAVAIAHFPPNRPEVQYWGAGNIAGAVLHDHHRSNLLSLHGTVGLTLPRLQKFTYPWTDDSLIILHSDGLNGRWEIDGQPGLGRRDAALVAGVLYRDFQRGNDDCTVVVARPRKRDE